MNKPEIAQALFKEGFNCSQALLAAYGTDLGIERDIALKIAGAFGGGIGRMGETCGVVTGAFMIIGLKYGAINAKDKTAKAKTYEVAKAFVSSFEAINNSVKCRELLGFNISTKPDSGKIISKQCPKYVVDAVAIIDKIL